MLSVLRPPSTSCVFSMKARDQPLSRPGKKSASLVTDGMAVGSGFTRTGWIASLDICATVASLSTRAPSSVPPFRIMRQNLR